MLYLNGKFIADTELSISPYDRGVLLGDGIFETMRAVDSEVEFLKAHWQRLSASASILNMPISFDLSAIKQIISELLQKNGLDKGSVALRLTLTRGTGPRGLLPPKHTEPTLMMMASKLGEASRKNDTLIVSSMIRNEYSPLSNIKSINCLENVMARVEAEKQGADEAIILNTKQNVAETTSANIFVIKNDIIYTPKLSDGALPGILRQVLFEISQQKEMMLEEKTFDLQFLLSASEVFLTNSLIQIKPIKQVNVGEKVKHFNDEHCQRIIQLFNQQV